MSAYVEAKHAEAQRRRADLLAQMELAERAGCKSMAEMAEFLNRSGFHNDDGVNQRRTGVLPRFWCSSRLPDGRKTLGSLAFPAIRAATGTD